MDDIKSKSVTALFGDESVGDELILCDVGFEYCAPKHTYGPTVREYYLFHLVIDGQGTFKINDRVFDVTANQAFFVRPEELHTYVADEQKPWHYAWLGFKGSKARELVARAVESGKNVFDLPASFAMELEQIILTTGDKNALILRLTAFLYQLLSELYSQNPARAVLPVRRDVAIGAIKFIENNYFRPLDMSELADELGMSRSHFTTVFTAAVGEPPYAYLTRYRISKAQELLRNTDLAVTEIGYAVGFSSIERFSQMFKKYVGCSPLNYAKKNR